MPHLIILMGRDNARIQRGVDRWIHLNTALKLAPHIRLWPEVRGLGTPEAMPRNALEQAIEADHLLAESDRLGAPVLTATHSDVFVLRLRRRVAERVIAPGNVELVWFDEEENGGKSIPLNDRGTPEWWPKGLGAEPQDEFHAIRRVLAVRDLAAKEARSETPTLPDAPATGAES